MSLPKLVIFDCDGILVDTENLANRRLSEWLTAAGYPTSFEYCRKNFSGHSMVSVQKVVEATGVSLGDDFVDRWNAGLPDLFAHGVEAVPYVREFVEAVRAAGIAYCVATSARVSKMHITLGQTGLLPLFEHALFSSTMVGRGKPFPDLFLKAAIEMNQQPFDCVVVEDSVPGVQAAKSAGMRVLGYVAAPHTDRDAMAKAGAFLFSDMKQLPELVQA